VSGTSSKTVIDAWLHYYKTPRFLDQTVEAARRFNASHPEYDVRISRHDYVLIPGEIGRAAARGERPAIAQYYSTSTRAAADMTGSDGAPLFTSVDAAVAGRDEILGVPVTTEDIVDPGREYFRLPDGFSSLSTLVSTTLLYANTDLLRAAGVEQMPRTWQEVTEACRAVTHARGGPAHGITWACHGWMFQQAVACQGGTLTDADNGRGATPGTVTLDSEEMLAYVDWWRGLHQEGQYLYTGVRMTGPGTDVPESHLQPWVASFQAFAEGRTAFLITSSVDSERLVQVGRERGFTVRAGRLPYNAEVPYRGNILGGDSLYLGHGLDEEVRDGALAFMQFLNSPENAADRHRVSGYMPSTVAGRRLLEEEGWFERNPHRAVAGEQLAASGSSGASLGAVVGELPRIQDLMTEAMHDVLADKAAPAARFALATEAAQRLLDEYNVHGPTNYRVH